MRVAENRLFDFSSDSFLESDFQTSSLTPPLPERRSGRLSLEELREKIGAIRLPDSSESFHAPGLSTGIPRGILVEVLGVQRYEWFIQVLAQNSGFHVAWIESRLSIFPTAILQRRVDLQRLLFLEAGVNASWAALQALKSGIFPILALDGSSFPTRQRDRSIRRLQLCAEKSRSTLFIFSEQAIRDPGISFRLNAGSDGIQVFKKKY